MKSGSEYIDHLVNTWLFVKLIVFRWGWWWDWNHIWLMLSCLQDSSASCYCSEPLLRGWRQSETHHYCLLSIIISWHFHIYLSSSVKKYFIVVLFFMNVWIILSWFKLWLHLKFESALDNFKKWIFKGKYSRDFTANPFHSTRSKTIHWTEKFSKSSRKYLGNRRRIRRNPGNCYSTRYYRRVSWRV